MLDGAMTVDVLEQEMVQSFEVAAGMMARTDGWMQAANMPWTERIRPHFRDLLVIDCKRYQRAN